MTEMDKLKNAIQEQKKWNEENEKRHRLLTEDSLITSLHTLTTKTAAKPNTHKRVKKVVPTLAGRTIAVRPADKRPAAAAAGTPINLKAMQRLQQLEKEKTEAMKKYIEIDRMMNDEAKKV